MQGIFGKLTKNIIHGLGKGFDGTAAHGFSRAWPCRGNTNLVYIETIIEILGKGCKH